MRTVDYVPSTEKEMRTEESNPSNTIFRTRIYVCICCERRKNSHCAKSTFSERVKKAVKSFIQAQLKHS